MKIDEDGILMKEEDEEMGKHYLLMVFCNMQWIFMIQQSSFLNKKIEWFKLIKINRVYGGSPTMLVHYRYLELNFNCIRFIWQTEEKVRD